MICPVCKSRWSPLRKDHWRHGSDGEPLIVPYAPNAEELWQRDYDDDHLVTCRSCSLR